LLEDSVEISLEEREARVELQPDKEMKSANAHGSAFVQRRPIGQSRDHHLRRGAVATRGAHEPSQAGAGVSSAEVAFELAASGMRFS
jgi:hypothetical protein